MPKGTGYGKDQSAEELAKGLRRRGGHFPPKASESARKKKEQEAQNRKQGYEVLD